MNIFGPVTVCLPAASSLSGAARGCGWQNLCAFINLGAYYVVGLPSSVLFAFVFHIGGMVSTILTLLFLHRLHKLCVSPKVVDLIGAVDGDHLCSFSTECGTHSYQFIH